MSFLSWIIVGLVGGILGKLLHPGSDGGGLIRTIILGVIGGLVGNAIASRFLDMSVTGINWTSIGIAAGGSLLVLIIWRAIHSKK